MNLKDGGKYWKKNRLKISRAKTDYSKKIPFSRIVCTEFDLKNRIWKLSLFCCFPHGNLDQDGRTSRIIRENSVLKMIFLTAHDGISRVNRHVYVRQTNRPDKRIILRQTLQPYYGYVVVVSGFVVIRMISECWYFEIYVSRLGFVLPIVLAEPNEKFVCFQPETRVRSKNKCPTLKPTTTKIAIVNRKRYRRNDQQKTSCTYKIQ